MGGCMTDDDAGITSPLTLVLVGRTGNGKSATGNSILGAKEFKSKRSSSGVTSTSELKTTVLDDGLRLNVIDTPGLFDSSVDPKFIQKEIVQCMYHASDGIHAILLVFSVCCRFSEEEKAAISSLVTLFGKQVHDYIIVVFTGGDELEEDGKTLDDFLSDCPEALKETLVLCGNRCVLFDNKTNDHMKKSYQLHKLLSAVSMVECKLKEANSKLEKRLANERAARMKAEAKAKAAKMESEKEKRKLREQLERERMERQRREEELRNRSSGCVIL